MSVNSLAGQHQTAKWIRVLRPLLLWILLVLLLIGIQAHERAVQNIRLRFSVFLENQPAGFETTATLDGRSFQGDEVVSLGRHHLTITNPKGDTYSTNLFIWYGGRDLGRITLKRAKGQLVLSVRPGVRAVSIRGPEFNSFLFNSEGLTTNIPTDIYYVEARFRHTTNYEQIAVTANGLHNVTIAPRFGSLELACNQMEATFELRDGRNALVEVDHFPSSLVELPEGSYILTSMHHEHPLVEKLEVKGGATNSIHVEYKYGAAILKTDPPGASVTGNEGKYWGKTPVELTEQMPGPLNFTMRLEGYEPLLASLAIEESKTNSFQTNLINQSYVSSLKAGQKYLGEGRFEQAILALQESLRIQPNDSVANSLLSTAKGSNHLARAVLFGEQTKYDEGIKELKSALAIFPSNQDAMHLLETYEKAAVVQAEKRRVERLNLPKVLFESELKGIKNSSLFESHELKTSKSINAVGSAINGAFETEKPIFQITKRIYPNRDTFIIEGFQEFTTFLATVAGRRELVIVGGQTKDDEVQILFKVLEYKTEAVNKFSIGAALGTPVAVNYLPIHPSQMGPLSEKLQAQLQEGVSNLTSRVKAAVDRAK